MKRLHHLLAVLAIPGGQPLALPPPGGVATLVSGQSVAMSGTSASALLWSVGAVVLAAYGLQFTLRGLVRIIASCCTAGCCRCRVHKLCGRGGGETLCHRHSRVTLLTGVAGENALELVGSVALTGWHLSAVLSGVLAAGSAALAIFMPDKSASSDRFEGHVHGFRGGQCVSMGLTQRRHRPDPTVD